MTTNQTAPVTDEELDQMILKLERDGMTPKMLSLMRELREVRKAKGEPVAWRYRYVHTPKSEEHGSHFTTNWKLCDSEDECNPSDCFERQALFAAPPEPVVPDVIATDDIPYSVGRFRTHRDCYRDGWNACRAAMHLPSNSEQLEPVSNRDELMTNSFTNEDLAGMAHGDSPQANAYRELLAFRRNSPATPDGWIPVSERMPENATGVLVASPWQCAPGGYAMKWATLCPGHPDADSDGWIIPGASWSPTHWHPLPAAPNFREISNSSTNNCREITETSTSCHKCGGRGIYHCPQMLGTVECECTLSAAPKEVG